MRKIMILFVLMCVSFCGCVSVNQNSDSTETRKSLFQIAINTTLNSHPEYVQATFDITGALLAIPNQDDLEQQGSEYIDNFVSLYISELDTSELNKNSFMEIYKIVKSQFTIYFPSVDEQNTLKIREFIQIIHNAAQLALIGYDQDATNRAYVPNMNL